jgi:ketosteroid isomerase-like protein
MEGGAPGRDTGWAMSQENVEIVRRGYEVQNSLGRTGPDFVDPEQVAPDFWARLDPSVEWYDREELPDATVYRGPEGAKEFFRKTQQLFAEARWEPQEFIDLGHAVAVVVKLIAIGRGSGVRVELDETDVFWFRGGRIVRIQGFATKEQAFEAAGLSE